MPTIRSGVIVLSAGSGIAGADLFSIDNTRLTGNDHTGHQQIPAFEQPGKHKFPVLLGFECRKKR